SGVSRRLAPHRAQTAASGLFRSSSRCVDCPPLACGAEADRYTVRLTTRRRFATMKLRALIAATAIAAAAVLAMPAVSSAQPEGVPVTVKLKTGETVTGQFVERGAVHAVVKSDTMGEVTIPVNQIDSVNGGPYVPTAEVGMFKSDFLSGWSRSFDF